MSPDRINIPGAKEFRRICRPIFVTVAILAPSIIADAQPTPRVDFLPTPPASASRALANLEEGYQLDIPVEIQAKVEPVIQDAMPERTTADDTLHRITGYYCQQIPGYPLWDGGGYCGLTRIGFPVSPGIAACGSDFQLGSKIEVEGVGRFLCADTGNLASGQVDIYYPTNRDLALSQKPDWAKVKVTR